MNVNSQTAARIDELLRELAKRFPQEQENEVMTDLSFQVKPDSGELIVWNDDDEELCSVTVDDWIDNQDDNFYEQAAEQLKQMLRERKQLLENLGLLKPFSLLMVDENKETVSELYLVDDNMIILESEELMKGLDKDLDDFINRLLAD